jgi:hypothetical protein
MSSEQDFCCPFLNLFGCSFEEESVVRDVISTPDLGIGTGSARSETRPDRGRLLLMAVGPLSRSAI